MITIIRFLPLGYLTLVVACLMLASAVYPDSASYEKRGHLIRREELDVSDQAEILQDSASLLDIESSHGFANSSGNESSANASNSSKNSSNASSSTGCKDTTSNNVTNGSRNVTAAILGFELGKCKCIAPELDHYPIIEGREITEGYAKHLGSQCKAWDNGVYPGKCQDTTKDRFCLEKWCFVDPCQCDTDSLPVASLYFPDKKLYYSYEACGGKDFFTKEFNTLACSNYQDQKSCGNLRDCKWIGARWNQGKCIGTELKTCLDQGRGKSVASTTNATNVTPVNKTNVTSAAHSSTAKKNAPSASAPAKQNATPQESTSIPIVIALYATIPLQIIVICCIYGQVAQKQSQKGMDTDDSDKTTIQFKMTIGGADTNGVSSDQALLKQIAATISEYVVELTGNAISASDVDASSFDFDHAVNVFVKVRASPPSDETVLAALRDAIAGPFSDSMASRLRSAPGFSEVSQGEVFVSCSEVEVEGRP